jgi:hypothetical protein
MGAGEATMDGFYRTRRPLGTQAALSAGGALRICYAGINIV